MDINDYSKFKRIKINGDLPISFLSFDKYHDILDVFRKLNIETLEDLFKAYDEGYFNDKRKRYNIEIKGQTELLMAYYMNTPLVADKFLEKTVCLGLKEIINQQFENPKFVNDLMRVGISRAELGVLYRYSIFVSPKLKEDENKTSIRLDQLIKSFANDKEYQSVLTATNIYNEIEVIQNLKFKSNFYETYLENKRAVKEGFDGSDVGKITDKVSIDELRKQLGFLLKARGNLDRQIELLQNKLGNVREDLKRR